MIRWLINDWTWFSFLPPVVVCTGLYFIRRENKETERLRRQLAESTHGELGFVKVSWGTGRTTCDVRVVRVSARYGQLIITARRTFTGVFTIPAVNTCDWDWHAYDGTHVFSAVGMELPAGVNTVVDGDLTLELPIQITDSGCLRSAMEPPMERPEPKAI